MKRTSRVYGSAKKALGVPPRARMCAEARHFRARLKYRFSSLKYRFSNLKTGISNFVHWKAPTRHACAHRKRSDNRDTSRTETRAQTSRFAHMEAARWLKYTLEQENTPGGYIGTCGSAATASAAYWRSRPWEKKILLLHHGLFSPPGPVPSRPETRSTQNSLYSGTTLRSRIISEGGLQSATGSH